MKKYELEYGGQFLKDLKLAKRRGLNMMDLSDVIGMLQEGKVLPEKYRDHILTGNYKGYRECHVNPDWLLIYKRKDVVRVISLYRTGTHSICLGNNSLNKNDINRPCGIRSCRGSFFCLGN